MLFYQTKKADRKKRYKMRKNISSHTNLNRKYRVRNRENDSTDFTEILLRLRQCRRCGWQPASVQCDPANSTCLALW